MEDFDALEPNFRRHFDRNFANSKLGYNQVRQAYRFGVEEARDNDYGNLDWNQAAIHIHQDWDQMHPDMAWNDVVEAVHAGWEAGH